MIANRHKSQQECAYECVAVPGLPVEWPALQFDVARGLTASTCLFGADKLITPRGETEKEEKW